VPFMMYTAFNQPKYTLKLVETNIHRKT